MKWQKDRPATAGEREFHLTGLREIGDARILDEVVAADVGRGPEMQREPEWNPKWS